MLLALLGTVLSGLAAIYYFYLRSLRAFPPGPRGLPFLGCIFAMPTEKEWLAYARWSKLYGDIVGLNVVGHKIVVLHNPVLVNQLFDRRGAIYSDRPKIPMLDMMGISDWSVGSMPYGERLRTCRKLIVQVTKPETLRRYSSVQEYQVYKLLQNLMDVPNSSYKHLKLAAGGIAASIFLGYRAKSDLDDFMSVNDEHIAYVGRAASFAEHPVNAFPILMRLPPWFPGAKFHQDAANGARLSQKIFDFPIELANRRKKEGIVVPCFMNSVLESGQNISEGQAAAATIYAASTETTASTLASFILAMVLHPGIQREAQAEVAQAIGTQLPRLEDRERLRLPFVEAVIKETYRWNPVANLGVPHRLTREDTVQGYVLPQGTILLSNIWAILHDEKRYPRPLEFVPGRYLGRSPAEDPRGHVFGYGRRACPGRNLVDAVVWLTVVAILASFDIGPDTDQDGKEVPVVPEYTTGFASRPKDFRCSIRPRHCSVRSNLMQSLLRLENSVPH